MELSPDKKIAGVLAPLFALGGRDDLGVGDIGSLEEFVAWAAEAGFGVVQLLPINETGNDNSPYNAISSVALEPTTIHVARVPDLARDEIEELTHGVDLHALRNGPVVYPVVKALKRALLQRAFENFSRDSWKKNDARARRFRRFCKTQAAWLESYALFRVLIDENQGTERWDRWPIEQQTFDAAQRWLAAQPGARRRALRQAMRCAMYVQWIALNQWTEAKLHAERLGVALMGDLPFGVGYYSADVWGAPELFDHRWSGGAPPEPFFTADPFTHKWGQNWGIPLYSWEAMGKTDFAWWRQRVRRIRDIFHLFRLDHVLGFYRIYAFPWRPQRNADFLPLTKEEARKRTGGEWPRFQPRDDETVENRAANRAQGEKFLRVLLAETGAFRLIGEDLGIVPDYVRPSLQSLGIPGFKIPFWEKMSDGRLVPGEAYQRLSVATFGTHDHDPLRVLWEKWMGTIENALHQPGQLARERDEAWAEVRRLAAWAGFEVPRITPFDKVHEKLLAALWRSNSWLAIVMITDLFATSQRFNMPGSVAESNWSERLAQPIARWRSDPVLREKTAHVRPLLRATGRLGPGA